MFVNQTHAVTLNIMKCLFLLVILCVISLQITAQTPQCDAQCVQRLQSAVEFETLRANAATKERDAWQTQAATWQQLFLDERERSKLLAGANTDRTEVIKFQGAALMNLREQVALDKLAISDLSREVRTCEKSKFRATIISFGVGAMTGAVLRPKFSF